MLERFSTPGGVNDTPNDTSALWSAAVKEIFTDNVGPQFFDPTQPDAPEATNVKVMRWGAFPKKLALQPAPGRYRLAENRNDQEEYCEWAGIWDTSSNLTSAAFTTETLKYYGFLAATSPESLLALYREHVPEPIDENQVLTESGYDPLNRYNMSYALHMIQEFNTLSAAIILAAQSSVVRTDPDNNDQIVTNTGQLIRCGITADPERNSDPLIVSDVNALARTGAMISLQDPVGLYIHAVQAEQWETPDGSGPNDWWNVTRGAEGHAMRAVFGAPEGSSFTLTDLRIGGVPVTSPSQIAEHISVRLTGVAHIGEADPVLRECSSGGLEAVNEQPSLFPTRMG